jgi:hypothetical protein
MRFLILADHSQHQSGAASALAQGLQRHGHRAEIVAALKARPENAAGIDAVACWGWRRASQWAPFVRTLVIEHGFVGDRRRWHSFGWDGLNGQARFATPDDGGKRWRRRFALAPECQGGGYALILGQVAKDAAVAGIDLDDAYRVEAERLEALGHDVRFRDHPRSRERHAPQLKRAQGDLADALRGASLASAISSNALVDARIAGVPIGAQTKHAMAWGVQGEEPEGLERWAHALAWAQWLLDEVRSGDAIETILAGRDAERFAERSWA